MVSASWEQAVEGLLRPERGQVAPPTQQGLWARDQFLALSAAAFVPRCGARSPARCLPPALAADEIGRPWVVPRDPAAAVVLRLRCRDGRVKAATRNNVFWVVTFSGTGGVVGVKTWECPLGNHVGWLSAEFAVIEARVPCVSALLFLVGTTIMVCQLPWMDTYGQGGFVRNNKWALNLSFTGIQLTILDLTGPLLCYKQWAVLNMSATDPPSWVDIVERGDDEAALGANRAREIWIIDIPESYSTRRLCIKQRLTGFGSTTKGRILTSDNHQVIVPVHQRDLWTLRPTADTVLRKCRSEPHKVDTHHFVEVTHRNHRLEVFSTGDMEHPCNVIHNTTRISFVCGGGLIAFLDENDRIDLVDALSGTLILTLLVPSDFVEDSFAIQRGKVQPPSFALRARDQFLALGAAVYSARCGARSPGRCLAPALLAAEIGRRWVLSRPPAAAVVLRLRCETICTSGAGWVSYDREVFWVVTFSGTGGVIDVEPWGASSGTCLGWLTANLAVVLVGHMTSPGAMGFPMVMDCSSPVGGSVAACRLPWICSTRQGFVCNNKWALRTSDDELCLSILDLTTVSSGKCTKLPVVHAGRTQFVTWVDFVGRGGDEAALGVPWEIWIIDIRESYSTGKLCVKECLTGFGTIRGRILTSDSHQMIVPVTHIAGRSRKATWTLNPTPHSVVRKCRSEPHKVDTHHFVEVTHRNHRLEVFSTGDMEHPCNVIHNTTRISFVCGGGLIAFLEENDRIDLVDALSGTLVLTLPVPSNFNEETFTMWVVGAQ
ncbi:hypothetical protein Pelo_10831 [Pelomyxa schiedti]|nr:hypothetical protein Pelo_10831 [Pelomyxa schiedti]